MGNKRADATKQHIIMYTSWENTTKQYVYITGKQHVLYVHDRVLFYEHKTASMAWTIARVYDKIKSKTTIEITQYKSIGWASHNEPLQWAKPILWRA